MAKKPSKKTGFNFLIISSIISLNLLGVGYSQWNDGIKINTSFSLGEIELRGEDNFHIEMYPGETKKITVRNTGTLPVRVDPINYTKDRGKIRVSADEQVLDTGEELELTIEAQNSVEETDITFRMPYRQWNVD